MTDLSYHKPQKKEEDHEPNFCIQLLIFSAVAITFWGLIIHAL